MTDLSDTLLTKGGFLTSRDLRNTNVRLPCIYCSKKDLLQTSYGLHIAKEHIPLIFDTNAKEGQDNRLNLYKRNSTTEPFYIRTKADEDLHFCFGCNTSFKSGKKAMNHFTKKGCKDKHEQVILKLRDLYPKDGKSPVVPQAKLKNKNALEDMVSKLLERVRSLEHKYKPQDTFAFEEKFARYFDDWDMDLHEETLKEYWEEFEDTPAPSETTTPEKTTPSVEDNTNVAEFYVPKPMTSLAHIEELLKDPTLDEASKAILKKSLPAPAPSPAPAPEPVHTLPDWSKKSPWEKLVLSNPRLKKSELIQVAAQMGIVPDASVSTGIISNTKMNR